MCVHGEVELDIGGWGVGGCEDAVVGGSGYVGGNEMGECG